MLNLHFARSHFSITQFPSITLPDFVIVTGPNGAGKSHLLQAIQHGAIKTDVAPDQGPNHQLQIRMFDWSTMVPHDTGLFGSETIRNERHNLLNQYSNLRNNQGWLEPARSIARQFGLGAEFLSEPGKVLATPPHILTELVGSQEQAVSLKQQISAALGQFENNVFNTLDASMRPQLRAVMQHFQLPLILLTEKEILSPQIPTWGQVDLFQNNFAKLFVAYRDIRLANKLAQLQASQGENAHFLTDEEFIDQHGPAPWDFVNRTISVANLDFEINAPELYDYTSFQPTLRKRSTGVSIPFQALSSGEKVLMSFAFCVYYSNDRRQLASRPKVLLLDEIDAPLHPSMSRNIIDTITKTLVGEFGIRVIATTHSPSTVAMADEDAIFTMEPNKPGLQKSSKATALNILTVGVPTIAISFDGRRQVFVESPTDAKIYDALYKLVKSKTLSERSLEFIATGTRSSGGGDRNTGCDNVIRVVASLASAGNSSVFGLLDWDGTRQPDDRISVLAHGTRNGIENVLFDPLLIALAIARSHPSELYRIGFRSGAGYLDVAASDEGTFQGVVDSVGHIVFGAPAESRLNARYLGGLSLLIDGRFGSTDDHELEEKVLAAFPFLRAISRGRAGKFLEHMTDVVLTDTQFIPVDILDVFRDLLERPSHR
ncbi:hypothetical protein EHI44_16765 [Rhizobium leguminosarum]|uniref:AAA family ATPase n=1 Tax=Rhizobium leguminosarum TaxID=384 RepID=UPI000FEF5652|nr:AAA family ATPase [Rhizobium leguminosarum]RWY85167.1 hypothetical protein EHI44_16765 [Rhizobium leguminosarum]